MTTQAPTPAPAPLPAEPTDPEPLDHRVDPEKRGSPKPPTPPEHEHPKQP
jgi:hypothetical protein